MFSWYVKNLISIPGTLTLSLKEGEIWSPEASLLLRELRGVLSTRTEVNGGAQ